MSFTRIIVLAAMTGAMTAGLVSAQTTSTTVLPAEFPPESFTGKQYVDSNGCIFIRAGVSGNVTWVPRVGRDRKQICGYQPSTDSASAAAVPQPRTAAAPPIEIAPDSMPTAATGTSTAPTIAATTTPQVAKPQTTTVAAPTAAAPKAPAAAAAHAVPAQQAVVDTRSYILAIDGNTGETILVPPKTRVIPKHVYDIRRTSQDVKVPRGYRAGWKDDRLNLRRAEGTLEGRASMNLVWTNTVPRRLVSASTGQVAEPPLPVVYIVDRNGRSKVAAISTQSTAVNPPSRAAKASASRDTDSLR